MAIYNTPLFIGEKAKILGPLDVSQFAILLSSVILTFIIKALGKNTAITILAGIILIGGGLFLCFGKIRGESVVSIVIFQIRGLFETHRYIWQKEVGKGVVLAPKIKEEIPVEKPVSIFRKPINQSALQKRIKELEIERREKEKEVFFDLPENL